MRLTLAVVMTAASLVILVLSVWLVRTRRKRREPVPVAAPTARGLGRGLVLTRQFLAEKLGALSVKDHIGEDDLEEIEDTLIQADVGVKSARLIVERLGKTSLTPQTLVGEVRSALIEMLDQSDRTFGFNTQGPTVWLVAGVNGGGKTTSIAKLAHRLDRDGRTVALAAADTFRAAAIDQLGEWATRVGVHMVRHKPGADPGAVVFDAIEHAKAKSIDVVIVDTAGRLHTKTNLMEELKKIRRIAERQAGEVSESLLVLDATVGQNGISQARVFGEALGLTGVILTKLDGTARGGIVVAIQEQLGIPVKAVGVGEGLEDLEEFDPEAFAEGLLSS